jgi:hypothetical protein
VARKALATGGRKPADRETIDPRGLPQGAATPVAASRPDGNAQATSAAAPGVIPRRAIDGVCVLTQC